MRNLVEPIKSKEQIEAIEKYLELTSYELQNRQEKYFKDKINDVFKIEMSLTKQIAMLSPIMYFIAALARVLFQRIKTQTKSWNR